MKKLFAVFACLAILAGMPDLSYAACYSPQEYEAEQGIRIHSELMVIGLTCQKMPAMGDSYSKYKKFTLKNERLISGYEDTIIGFFRRKGAGSPDLELHGLRTKLANQISRQAITMSTKTFCTSYGPRIDKALQMDEGTIRRWAQQVWKNNATSQPVCKGI